MSNSKPDHPAVSGGGSNTSRGEAAPALNRSAYYWQERRRNETWKSVSPLLPDAARSPAVYPRRPQQGPLAICLPVDYATYNLLPAARGIALATFTRDGIKWHDEANSGPSSHLLDSQVQCVNALAPLASDPDRLTAAFQGILPIAAVLPVTPGARDYVEFEYIGDDDYLREAADPLTRTRGQYVTSVDAAIRYTRHDGATEIALIEWKYTEDYRDHTLSAAGQQTRHDRYQALWDDDDMPLRRDAIPYAELFAEPFYQLMRQQFLAWQMTLAHERDADAVRVVHISPHDNHGFGQSLTCPSHHAAGTDVYTAWASCLREPTMFQTVDSGRFADRGLGWADPDYCDRYGPSAEGGDDRV